MSRIQQYFSDFILYCKIQKNLSEKTLKAYQIDTNQFLVFLLNYEDIKEVTDINRDHLRIYLQVLSDKYKIKSVKRKVACLKAFFNYLEYEDKILFNPFRKVKIKLQMPFKLPTVLTLHEVQILFSVIYYKISQFEDTKSYSYKASIRDITVLEFLFATGLRVSELCNLKRSEIDLANGYIKVSGKGSRERIIFIENDEVKRIINRYKSLFETEIMNSEYFFINRVGARLSEQSVRFMIKKYANAVGIEKHVTPHVFRHSFATLLLEEGVDIKYIQNFLGHSSIVTTQIYTHVNKEKEREILGQKHPRKNLVMADLNEVNEG